MTLTGRSKYLPDRRASNAAIRTPVAPVATADAVQPETKLTTWVIRYWQEEVEGGAETTVTPKRRDLQLFLDYLGRILCSDHLDDWTHPRKWQRPDAGTTP